MTTRSRWSALEPPLHRPRPCPRCTSPSTAIVDGACLGCRSDGDPPTVPATGKCAECQEPLLLNRPGRTTCARCELVRKETT